MTVVRLLSYLCHMIYKYFMLTTCTPHHSSSFSCCPDIFFTLILVDWSLESKKKRYKMNKSRKEKRWKYRTHIFTYSHCFMLTWPLVTTQDILKTHFFNFKPDLSRDLLLNLATKIDFAAKYEKKNYQYTVEKIFGCGISLRRPINTVYYIFIIRIFNLYNICHYGYILCLMTSLQTAALLWTSVPFGAIFYFDQK